MPIMTPAQIVSYWTNTDALVDQEVESIMSQILTREPCTVLPAHFNYKVFCLPLGRSADLEFMEKVAQKFRDAGWTADVKMRYGRGNELILGSPDFERLPKVERPYGA